MPMEMSHDAPREAPKEHLTVLIRLYCGHNAPFSFSTMDGSVAWCPICQDYCEVAEYVAAPRGV